jgi:hypothetical protein
MFLCEHGKRANLEGSIVLSGRKFLKFPRLFTIVSSSPYSTCCILSTDPPCAICGSAFLLRQSSDLGSV